MPKTNKNNIKKKNIYPKNQENKNTKEKQAKILTRLRGMRDILPDEYYYFDFVRRKAEEITSYYGFQQTDIPILENLSLYERTTGKQTDIVQKEMYSFIDKDGDRVGIRPEATPSLVRSYIEHGLFNLPYQPVKLFWMGSVLRREKPQSGRQRQFNQINLEVFGDANPVVDAQLILIAWLILKEFQINSTVQINSIGNKSDRDEYIKKLQDYFKDRKVRSLLSVEDKKRLIKNPLRILDSKEEGTLKALEGVPQIIDHISDECREHFMKVLEYLDEFDIPYALNSNLVRGLDYYNRTVFEFWPEETETGRQNALGGGGRYDSLIEQMGGRPSPACGFALGAERIILKIKEQNIPLANDRKPDIFLAQLGDAARRKSMIFFEELRKKGYKASQNFIKDSLKAQLEAANKLGVKLTLILGQKELMDGTILVRDMESGMQEVFDFKKIYEELDKRLKA